MGDLPTPQARATTSWLAEVDRGRWDSLANVTDLASSLYSCREPGICRTGRTEAAARAALRGRIRRRSVWRKMVGYGAREEIRLGLGEEGGG
jgi:hypothetical protein